ncbi:MAG: hypothetical protein KAS32_30490 [Candidatus Peribacteraceae bacterium]|nr:hypothetical protein [Candidatus Peribacteraceae bacterium]
MKEELVGWFLNNLKKNTFVLLEVILLVLILIFLPQYLNSLGPDETVILFLVIIISLSAMLSVMIVFFSIRIYEKIFDKKCKSWAKSTLYLMFLFLVVGLCLISYNFGETQLSLFLRDSDNIGQVVGNITCEDDAGKMIVDHEINCEFYPNISIISANVTFTLKNGSTVIYDFSNRNFIAPDNCKYVYFRMVGIDENNETLRLEIGYPMSFYTEKENEERNEKYIAFIILLFGAVLFSVPSMVNNFKNLSKK